MIFSSICNFLWWFRFISFGIENNFKSFRCILMRKKTFSNSLVSFPIFSLSLFEQPLLIYLYWIYGNYLQSLLSYTSFFVSNTFISNAKLKSSKNQAKAKRHSKAELLLFENYSLSSSTLSSKSNRRYSKRCTKNKYVIIQK